MVKNMMDLLKLLTFLTVAGKFSQVQLVSLHLVRSFHTLMRGARTDYLLVVYPIVSKRIRTIREVSSGKFS